MSSLPHRRWQSARYSPSPESTPHVRSLCNSGTHFHSASYAFSLLLFTIRTPRTVVLITYGLLCMNHCAAHSSNPTTDIISCFGINITIWRRICNSKEYTKRSPFVCVLYLTSPTGILKSCCTEMQQLFSWNHLFKCMVFTPHQSKEVVFRP